MVRISTFARSRTLKAVTRKISVPDVVAKSDVVNLKIENEKNISDNDAASKVVQMINEKKLKNEDRSRQSLGTPILLAMSTRKVQKYEGRKWI